ncbi:transglycosylase domain-containing protein [Ramlibacter sp. XY19]|uniref:penicillin-binding protein 1A n=1 Tax=Ramlibacter paludis TaxID=2908000 RepID=UPI0023DBAF01|nr:transglycosylase domain-containing protein [Ramlibacter paludis]MCG2592755.1 transglycosylase domain-containing protein [Ramlibacter paludis]
MNERFARLGERIGHGAHATWGAIRRHPWKTVLAVPLAVVVYVAALIPFTPSIGDIKKSKQESPSVVLSADGKELAVFKRANRDWVKLSDISPKAVEALLATEDKRFYDHHGIDFTRTAKAALNTFKGDVQGGSTITQQLARNLYPEDVGREQTITRKIKEAITALKIEAVYSKDEILESYLNSVSFLYNAWGIEMAARTYFDKPAKQLNELEAATLIGMLKGTSYYNPVLNPERARERRNTVLAQLVKADKLSEGDYEKLKAQPLKLNFERQPEVLGPAPHLAEYLRRWLLEWADKHDYNIYADGLVVKTTIDSRLQEFANEAVKRQGEALQAVADVEWSRSSAGSFGTDPQNYVAQRSKSAAFDYFWATHKDLLDEYVRESAEFQNLRQQGKDAKDAYAELVADSRFMAELKKQKTTLQAGFLAIEPSTGHIKAWVGSRDYADDKFDHVQQARRQPGSTFKPFVYGAAFEMGHQPTETLMDQPVAIQIDRNQVWRPGDIEGAPTNMPMTLRDGLAKSKNTITAQLMMQVGPSRVASLARAMGVRQSKLNEVPSLALGTSPVTLKEMVTSFSTIANGGAYIQPTMILAIEDRQHNQLETFAAPASEPALSNQAAQTLLDVMRGVIDGGTAAGLRPRFQLTGDLAGKTGTTQDNTDGWFILMHPNLVAGAWTGFNDNRVAMRSSYWGQGAHTALFLVGDFMQRAQKASVVDAKAQFSAPRLKDQEQSILQGAKDWWNSVFNTPPANPDNPEVAAMPPVKIDPPVLIPAPSSMPSSAAAAQDVVPLESTRPNPNVTANAPVLVDPQRVPAFPRPLETARPAETVPGTQVYPVPQASSRNYDTVPSAPARVAPTAPSTPPATGSTSAMGAPSSPPATTYTPAPAAPAAPAREASPSAAFERATAPTATEPTGAATGSAQ